mmetsp:Transcript_6317/g.16946  ORF Transcript_6317/g.16946 Transcript_6317/m.16946 type:complete len:258 (+) Transcript_6317:64-837(+)
MRENRCGRVASTGRHRPRAEGGAGGGARAPRGSLSGGRSLAAASEAAMAAEGKVLGGPLGSRSCPLSGLPDHVGPGRAAASSLAAGARSLVPRDQQDALAALGVLLGKHVESPLDQPEELPLHLVQVPRTDAADPCIEGVGEKHVIEELRCHDDTGEEQAVHAQLVHSKGWVLLGNTVEVDRCQDKALVTAAEVLRYPRNVVVDGDSGGSSRVEASDHAYPGSASVGHPACQAIGQREGKLRASAWHLLSGCLLVRV